MGIGNYKPIKLYKYELGLPSQSGNYSENSNVSYLLWAEVTDESGSRSINDGMVSLNDTKSFKIYYRGYNPYAKYRIEYYGNFYEITAARRVDEKRFNWVLTASTFL